MEHKISLCTVCMNRLHHLKETFPKNMEDNSNYKNLEFVLLDYNSQDGMESWVKENFSNQINSGRLSYYKYPDAKKFNMAHAKNMLGRLGQGDIIGIVDADNYTGKNFASYINKTFINNNDCFITTINKLKIKNPGDTLGRVCFKKTDFDSIGGFDEFMNTYGYDDCDFANRLESLGRKRIVIKNTNFLQAITHGDTERFMSLATSKNFSNLYIRYITPSISEFLFLFKDNTYNFGLVKDMYTINSHLFTSVFRHRHIIGHCVLVQDDWIKGKWSIDDVINEEDENFINTNTIYLQEESQEVIRIGNKIFDRVSNEDYTLLALKLHPILANYNKMKKNKVSKIPSVNGGVYGAGIVSKNLNSQNVINIS